MDDLDATEFYLLQDSCDQKEEEIESGNYNTIAFNFFFLLLVLIIVPTIINVILILIF